MPTLAPLVCDHGNILSRRSMRKADYRCSPPLTTQIKHFFTQAYIFLGLYVVSLFSVSIHLAPSSPGRLSRGLQKPRRDLLLWPFLEPFRPSPSPLRMR